ncbi:MAG TPA: hypothetical protein ENK23_01610, partial [Sorangium sp.]|nr:hypothetical protein [Sorangium sp.]
MAEHPPPSSAPVPLTGWLATIAGLPLRNTKITVLVAAVILVVCAAFAWDLPISTSRYKLVSDENPQQAQLLKFFDRFGYPDSLVLVVSGGDEDTRRAAVDELDAQLSLLPELRNRTLGRLRPQQVAELLLLFRPQVLAQLRQRSGKTPADLVEGGIPIWLAGVNEQLGAALDGDGPQMSEAEAAAGLRVMAAGLSALEAQLAGEDPFVAMSEMAAIDDLPKGVGVDKAGYLVTQDGRANLVALFPVLPGAEGFEVKPLVDKVRAVRERVAAKGVTVALTGLPALVADELDIVKRGLLQTSVGTSVAILLLLLLAFRSKRYTVLALLPLGLGIVLTLAAVRGIYGGLNLITSSFVPVLLALGIDFGVYVLSRYGELVRRGHSTDAAIRGALAKAGPGMLIGALTTVLAFLMTTTTEFTAYSELGVITAVGLLLMVVVTFLLLPALIFLAGRGKQIAAPELKGMDKLPALINRGRWPVVLGALLLIGASAMAWPRIRFNARYFDFLPDSTESASGLRFIERDTTLSPVQAGVGADGVEQARALAEKLRALPEVGSVQTGSDLLPKLTDEGLKQLRLGFADLGRQPDFDKLRQRQRSTQNLAEKVR